MPQELLVKIVGDSKSYERALGRSATATNQFGNAMGKTSPKVGKFQSLMGATGFGVVGVVGAVAGLATVMGGKAVEAASALNEEINKSKEVFGDSADEVRAWSETTATSLGISQREALGATGTFGALFKTLSVGSKQNADLSKSLVQLASDMSSFNNANPEDVLLALRSGLTGEAEPLRKFGVFLSEARTQQVAFNQTGKTTASQLTNQEKVLARYSIIMKDTTSAQGDFARTSGGLANEQRTLAAETENLSASIGSFLVPAMETATAIAIELVGGMNDLVGALTGFHKLLKETEVFDGWNKGVEDTNKSTLDFLENLRDGIPFMQEFLDLRDKIKGAGGQPPAPEEERRGHGAGGRPAQTPAEVAAANAKAGQAAIDKITRQANASLDQQIRNSARRIAHLQDLIREDPGNTKLQQRLTAEIKKQNALLKERESMNASNAASARAAAKAAHEAAVQAAADAKEAARAAEERRRGRIKSKQFGKLGLTGEGLKPTPGAGSLINRALGLEQQIKGTPLDTPKVNAQLRQIVKVLKGKFGKAGKDVREAILSMLNDISGAFKDKKAGDVTGPLTKTHGLNTKKLVEGLGLTPEQERELRGRASKFNTAGRALGGNRTNAPGGSKVPGQKGGPAGPFVVESTVIVQLDGQQISRVVTRNQQKDRRRNPRQKRGQHRT